MCDKEGWSVVERERLSVSDESTLPVFKEGWNVELKWLSASQLSERHYRSSARIDPSPLKSLVRPVVAGLAP